MELIAVGVSSMMEPRLSKSAVDESPLVCLDFFGCLAGCEPSPDDLVIDGMELVRHGSEGLLV